MAKSVEFEYQVKLLQVDRFNGSAIFQYEELTSEENTRLVRPAETHISSISSRTDKMSLEPGTFPCYTVDFSLLYQDHKLFPAIQGNSTLYIGFHILLSFI